VSGEKPNALHYGDCLDILADIPDDSVDLIYLDPPFNSNANYNMLFGDEQGEDTAQVHAFTDTWYWRPDHEDVYSNLMLRGGTLGNTAEALMQILGRCGMLAYLFFMMERLILMKRVLRKTGSIYLHCDPTASHYLKIIMDAVFGQLNFINEVIWHYQTGGGSRR
jgi:site-specific DNA-methyltransferase (adenine-specific)